MAVSGTLVKRIMVKITADDMDAEEKMDAISAKADELAEKHPELKVKIDSAAAMAKMKVLRDEIRAATATPVDLDPALQAAADERVKSMQENLQQLAERADKFRESVDGDKEALANLLSLNAGLEGMKEKLSDGRVLSSAEMASSESRLARIDVDLDNLKAKADGSGSNGLLGRILLGRGSESSGFVGGLVKWLPGIGESLSSGVSSLGNIGASTAGEAGQAAGDVGDSGPEGAAAVGGVVSALLYSLPAIAAELTGVVSGFAAAGVGAGAFALLAYPAIKQVTGALGDTKAQLLKLPLLEQDAVGDLQQLSGTWKQMSKAFEPQAFKVFTDALELADELLPRVTPFANAFAGSLDGLLKRADSFAASKGFSQWLGQFEKLVGPSTTAIGSGIGNVSGSLGKLLTTMSSKDDVNAINIAFSVIDGAIVGFTGFVKGAMVTWDALTTAWYASVDAIRTGGHYAAAGFDETRHASASFAHGTAHDFDDVRHNSAGWAHDLAGAFDVVRHGAAAAGHDTASAFDTMRGRIATEIDATVSWVRSHWGGIVAFLADPVGTAAGEIQRHTHQIASDFDTLRHDSASIFAGMRHDIATADDGMRHDASAAFDGMRHDISGILAGDRHDVAHWTDDVVSFFAGLPGRTVRALSRWAGDLFHSGESSTGQMKHGVTEGGQSVLSWFEGLPGRILHYLANLPGQMFSAGEHIIGSLASGIMASGGSALTHAMGWVGQEVVDHLPRSPAKKGPLSGAGSPEIAGRKIGLMIAEGISQSAPAIDAAMEHATQAARLGLSSHGLPGIAGTAAAGSHMTIQITGDAALRQWLKKSIRVTGGNVQVVGA